MRLGNGGQGDDRRPGKGYEDNLERIIGKKPRVQWVPPPLPINKRHDLDPVRVAAQIVDKVGKWNAQRERMKQAAQATLDSYERAMAAGAADRLFSSVPKGPGYVDPLLDSWISEEQTHFAKVRVIELPQTGKRFILVYGDADDATVTDGTGPFESFEKAAAWFYNGGR